MEQALDNPCHRNRHQYGRQHYGRHDEHINADKGPVADSERLECSKVTLHLLEIRLKKIDDEEDDAHYRENDDHPRKDVSHRTYRVEVLLGIDLGHLKLHVEFIPYIFLKITELVKVLEMYGYEAAGSQRSITEIVIEHPVQAVF